MSNKRKEILELLKSKGKSAPEMTHALKFIGDGSMEGGFARIGDYFDKEMKISTVKGAIGATLVCATIALVKMKVDDNKKHKAEGEAILKGLEDGLYDYSNENNILDYQDQKEDLDVNTEQQK